MEAIYVNSRETVLCTATSIIHRSPAKTCSDGSQQALAESMAHTKSNSSISTASYYYSPLMGCCGSNSPFRILDRLMKRNKRKQPRRVLELSPGVAKQWCMLGKVAAAAHDDGVSGGIGGTMPSTRQSTKQLQHHGSNAMNAASHKCPTATHLPLTDEGHETPTIDSSEWPWHSLFRRRLFLDFKSSSNSTEGDLGSSDDSVGLKSFRLTGRRKFRVNKSSGIMPSTASTSSLDAPSNTSSSLWKTAKDPASGREYYYHVETRQTQWRKPLELATADERKTLMEKDQQQRAFFQAMEKNILQGLAATNTPPATAKNTSESAYADEKELAPAAAAEMKIPASIARPGAMRVRTISTMDVMVLKDLIETLPSNNSSKPHGSRSQRHGSAFSNEGGSSGAFNSRSSLISIVEDSQDGDTDLEYSEELHKSQAIVQEFFQTLQDEECDGSSNGSDGDNNIDATAASDSHYNEQDPSESEFTVDADADNVRTKYMTEQIRPRRPHALSRDSIASSDSASTTSLSISALALGSDRNLSMSGSMSDASGILSEDGLGLLDEEEIMALRQLATAANQMLHLGDEEEEDTNFDLDEDDSLQGLHITSAASAPTPDTMTRDSLSLTDTSDSVGDRNINGDALVTSTSSATSLPSLPKPSSLAGDPPTRFPARPNMMRQRRNTCGTIYVSSTLSDPDKDATITCVCAVYRTHVLQSAMESATSNGSDGDADDYLMFNDLTVLQRRTDRVQFKNELPTEPPTLDEISSFYRAVFRRAKMEADCIIMSLIYVERLIKKTNGKLRPRPENWRSILFACMVLSSKVWDDLSMWNADFSQTCPAGIRFPLQRINQLEIAVLGCLEYNVKVKAGEYAKYYFLLRTMLIKSGLGGHDLDSMLPLDVEGAKRLQQVSTQYQTSHLPKPSSYRSRSVGMLSASMTLLSPGQGLDAKSFPKAGLEQLVKM